MTLKLDYAESESQTYEYYYYFVPYNAVIGTISGDMGYIISSGEDSYNVQNGTNDLLNSLYNNTSGEEGKPGIIQNVYNDLFTIESGELQSLIAETMQNVHIESGEIEEVKLIYNYLNTEPSDFIISWDNMTTHFTMSGESIATQLTIPANYINFSEMERNSQELHEAMRLGKNYNQYFNNNNINT